MVSDKQLELSRVRAQYSKIFSDNLKAARLRTGYARKYMADCMGVSVTSYGFYEQGKNLPTIENIIKISQILHVSIDSLLDNVPDEYQRCRNKFVGESIEFVDLDDGRLKISVPHADMTQTLIMSREDFIAIVRHAELRDGQELLRQFFRLFTDAYAYAANLRLTQDQVTSIQKEILEYVDMP